MDACSCSAPSAHPFWFSTPISHPSPCCPPSPPRQSPLAFFTFLCCWWVGPQKTARQSPLLTFIRDSQAIEQPQMLPPSQKYNLPWRSAQEDGREQLLRKLKVCFLAWVKQPPCYHQHCCPLQESKLFASFWFCCMLPLKQGCKVKHSSSKAQGAGAGQETKPTALIPNNDFVRLTVSDWLSLCLTVSLTPVLRAGKK